MILRLNIIFGKKCACLKRKYEIPYPVKGMRIFFSTMDFTIQEIRYDIEENTLVLELNNVTVLDEVNYKDLLDTFVNDGWVINKSGWEYRIVRRDNYYSIHEAYYRDQPDQPDGWTQEPITVGGSNLEDIKWQLEKMLKCLDLPILESE